jgi:gluconate 2-dehydrogenase gamma chain
MRNGVDTRLGRRGFLKRVAIAAGAGPLERHLFAASGAVTAAGITQSGSAHAAGAVGAPASELPAPTAGYESLSPDEAGFVEAMVNVMCPPDHLTPNGVDCGLATYIDRQLAGGYGKGERLYMCGPWGQGKPQQGYQLPLTPEQFYKAGIAAADEAARAKLGKGFVALPAETADAFLHDLAADRVKHARLSLASWFNELVYPLFVEACFADPIYGGNLGKVFWKMIGYPGLPATHTRDMLEFRGKPYPGAQAPKSMVDFS